MQMHWRVQLDPLETSEPESDISRWKSVIKIKLSSCKLILHECKT